jgi:hypothetical protein
LTPYLSFIIIWSFAGKLIIDSTLNQGQIFKPYICSSYYSLKNDEAGQATLAKFMVEEERAVRTGEIVAIGMNVIAEKMD